ncbi:MAG TPA: hypothetical protein GX714_04070 [Chloroflexi bacterium]|jgi:hypothetical protein|nr:hypothetical protein [Chloroflexota bacterium]
MPKNTKAGAGNTGQVQILRAAGKPSRTHSTTGQVCAQGKAVGRVGRDAIFRKSVRGSRHALRKPPAWALDIDSLLEAERLGATMVEIRDCESGLRYRASVERIWRHGITIDRGHGRQVALPLSRWTVWRPGEPRAEQQLHLFGEGAL